jgi:hypothetical protein
MSDASAAVALDAGTFLAADDETNSLRVYAIDGDGTPLALHDLSGFLGVEPKHPEADIEGAARVGTRVYWITSHGRNKNGKPRPNRYRFFATEVRGSGEGVTLTEVGQAHRGIVPAMLAEPALADLQLQRVAGADAEQARGAKRRRLAPKDEGLNIEGLSAAADGRSLYIGLRNPCRIRRRSSRKVLRRGSEPRCCGISTAWASAAWSTRATTLRTSSSPEATTVAAASSSTGGPEILARSRRPCAASTRASPGNPRR